MKQCIFFSFGQTFLFNLQYCTDYLLHSLIHSIVYKHWNIHAFRTNLTLNHQNLKFSKVFLSSTFKDCVFYSLRRLLVFFDGFILFSCFFLFIFRLQPIPICFCQLENLCRMANQTLSSFVGLYGMYVYTLGHSHTHTRLE